MSLERAINSVYLCGQGHELRQLGPCPEDGSPAAPAEFYCAYCDYRTPTSKSRLCPSCEAPMRVCSVSVCEVPAKEQAS